MNETFNFKRFWTYFKYDIRQMWRGHSKAVVLMGGSVAILYVVWALFALVFNQQWATPPFPARIVTFILAFMVLEFYQTRTYGYLTEKKAGSAWLMVPASRAEKFVSMMLVSLIVLPVIFFVAFFGIDAILSLVDPTYGKALIGGFMGKLFEMINLMSSLGAESPIEFTPANLAFPMAVGYFCNFLYFILCGVCFKKNKIVGSIAILFGVSVLLSIVSGLSVIHYAPMLENMDIDEMQLAQWSANFLNWMVAIECVLTVGLGWGVWRRVKTLQH
ncbi:MAG: hypothetical protein IJS07_04740 [Bacteroidales bacterium]|nr:hypothetical protein [Bacteroidales bacterium]